MMRAIPTRTDPLTRATMPAITSTAAMIHKMVSVLPPFAASIPRTSSMSPPFILGNYRRARCSVAHSVALRPFPTDDPSRTSPIGLSLTAHGYVAGPPRAPPITQLVKSGCGAETLTQVVPVPCGSREHVPVSSRGTDAPMRRRRRRKNSQTHRLRRWDSNSQREADLFLDSRNTSRHTCDPSHRRTNVCSIACYDAPVHRLQSGLRAIEPTPPLPRLQIPQSLSMQPDEAVEIRDLL
jgi:hypothetical protein